MKKLFICICFGLTIIGVTGCSDDEQSSESGTSKQISGCFIPEEGASSYNTRKVTKMCISGDNVTLYVNGASDEFYAQHLPNQNPKMVYISNQYTDLFACKEVKDSTNIICKIADDASYVEWIKQ